MFLLEDRRYYIYIYLDPRKQGTYKYKDLEFSNEPFYVGYGKNNRRYSHIYEANYKRNNNLKGTHKTNKINKIIKEGFYPIIKVLYDSLSSSEAKKLEIKLISLIGRYDLGSGTLLNLTNGGEGVVNYRYTEEQKKKRSKLSKKNNGFRGKKHTEESKIKISNRYYPKGKDNPQFGKSKSEEHKRKVKENHHNCKGALNSKAKEWIIISPEGDMFYCHGNINILLKQLGLPEYSMFKHKNSSIPKTSKSTKKDWGMFELKK